jgi:dihydrofolate reductase
MIVSLVVAASDNDVIGANGELPWHLPADLRRFRELTTGHVVVMGRVTYQSVLARLGRPLPGRVSVVLTRGGLAGPDLPGGPGVRVAACLPAALELAGRAAADRGDQEVFVAGGAQVYRQALPLAGRIYLTRVHQVVPGDAALPPGWLAGFWPVSREPGADPGSGVRYEFCEYRRET